MEYRLKEARIMKGLTLREAAKLLNLSHESVSKFEKGKLKLDNDRILQFAKAYGVTLDYIVGTRPKVEFIGETVFHKINWKMYNPVTG